MDAEELADALLAADAELQVEFLAVAEPDEDAEAELRRAKYIEVIRGWLDGSA